MNRLGVITLLVLVCPAARSQDTRVMTLMQSISASAISGHIEWLQTPGGQPGRVSFTPGFDSAAAYVERTFRSFPGISSVERDTFFLPGALTPFNTKSLVNIVATVRGSKVPEEIIVVGAHLDCSASLMGESAWFDSWQTIRAPGADDNASGVAAVIELARVFAQSSVHPERTIRFIAFGAEESGPVTLSNPTIALNGSQHFVNQTVARGDRITAMINLDMIGYNPTELFCDIEADSISGWLGALAVRMNTEYQLGLTTSQPPFTSGNGSDHHPFWKAQIPAILLIERYLPYPFNPYYHRSTDSLHHLNIDLARRITQLAGATAATMAYADAATDVVENVRGRQHEGLSVYPNPANPSTMIQYDLPRSEIVRLSLHDLLGREVEVLEEGERSTGFHAVRWGFRSGRSGLPAGVYFLRLQTSGSPGIARVLLLK